MPSSLCAKADMGAHSLDRVSRTCQALSFRADSRKFSHGAFGKPEQFR